MWIKKAYLGIWGKFFILIKPLYIEIQQLVCNNILKWFFFILLNLNPKYVLGNNNILNYNWLSLNGIPCYVLYWVVYIYYMTVSYNTQRCHYFKNEEILGQRGYSGYHILEVTEMFPGILPQSFSQNFL